MNGDSFAAGGALQSDLDVTVVDTAFEDNAGNTGQGGCISAAMVHATDSTFTDNGATGIGGCLHGLTDVVVGGSTFTDNAAVSSGGAIYSQGDIDVTDSTFGGISGPEGNTASSGGAITSVGGGDLSIDGSTFRNNRSQSNVGGAVFANGETTITDSTFEGNLGTVDAFADGGAVALTDGSLTVSGSTFADNGATGDGGAIHLADAADLSSVTNSTFEDNASDFVGASIASEAVLDVTHSTFADNSSTAGDLAYTDDGNEVELTSSIVVDKPPADTGTGCSGAITNGGYNVIFGESGSSTCPTGGTNVAADPILQALTDYGGPTETMMITGSSAALDLIPDAECETPTDQRGVIRPVLPGGMCDAGAVELDQLADGQTGDGDGDGVYNENGIGQTMSAKVKPRRKATFEVLVRNDATFGESSMVFEGPGSTNRFKVTYKDSGGDNITEDVTAGGGNGFVTQALTPGQDTFITVIVKAKKNAKKNNKMNVPVHVFPDGVFTHGDTVLAKVTVK